MKTNARNVPASPSGKDGAKRRVVEIAIVILVVLLAFAVFSATRLSTATASSGTSGGPFAVVQNADGFYQALPLSQDAELTVTCPAGENHVKVSGGKVSVDEADCANQVCVQAGAVNRIGDTIVCLPHKMVVQVVADPSDASPVQGLMG